MVLRGVCTKVAKESGSTTKTSHHRRASIEAQPSLTTRLLHVNLARSERGGHSALYIPARGLKVVHPSRGKILHWGVNHGGFRVFEGLLLGPTLSLGSLIGEVRCSVWRVMP